MIRLLRYAFADRLGQQPVLKVQTEKWTTPVHIIDSERSPRHTIQGKERTWRDIPIPEEAWADPMTDGHMALVDPRLRRAWEFSKFKRLKDGGVTATRVQIWDLDKEGYYAPQSGEKWWLIGANGSGTPLLGGLILPAEVESGEIRHALAMITPINTMNAYCYPAIKSDGWLDDPNAIPEGARVQLNPHLDLEKLGLSESSQVIATALQRYGAYVIDNGKGFAVKAQNIGEGGWNKHKLNLWRIPLEEFRVLRCNTMLRRGGAKDPGRIGDLQPSKR